MFKDTPSRTAKHQQLHCRFHKPDKISKLVEYLSRIQSCLEREVKLYPPPLLQSVAESGLVEVG